MGQTSDQKGRQIGQTLPPLVYAPYRPPVTWADTKDEVPTFDWTQNEGVTPPISGVPMLINRERPVASVESLGYPRLVMGSHQKLFSETNPLNITRALGKLWNHALSKSNANPNSDFRGRVSRLAERIGINDPGGTNDDASSWLRLVFEAKFWTDLLHRLKPQEHRKGMILDRYFWDQFYDDWKAQRPGHGDTLPREDAWLTDRFLFSIAAADDIQKLEWRGITSPDELRFQLSKEWTSEFISRLNGQSEIQAAIGLHGTPVLSISRKGQLLARCGVGAWALYERAKLYGAKELKTCQNKKCSRLFEPGQQYKYCSEQCERATNKRNDRARKAVSS